MEDDEEYIKIPKSFIFKAFGLLTDDGRPIAHSIRRNEELVKGPREKIVILWIINIHDPNAIDEDYYWNLSNPESLHGE